MYVATSQGQKNFAVFPLRTIKVNNFNLELWLMELCIAKNDTMELKIGIIEKMMIQWFLEIFCFY
jgi:hypothetical protein